LWPDFGESDILEAFTAFSERERRFGKTGAQVTGEESA
jgi:undecaprenyl pyrophosphate synthase